MTGSNIRTIREALVVDPFVLADVLGVHVSTVYRWEASKLVKVDPMQAKILTGLQERLSKTTQKVGRDLGTKIRTSLIRRGSLAGLRTVLDFLLET